MKQVDAPPTTKEAHRPPHHHPVQRPSLRVVGAYPGLGLAEPYRADGGLVGAVTDFYRGAVARGCGDRAVGQGVGHGALHLKLHQISLQTTDKLIVMVPRGGTIKWRISADSPSRYAVLSTVAP